MLSRVSSLVQEHKASKEFYTSERDPNYLTLVMMEQALTSKIKEMDTGTGVPVDMKNPKVQQAMKKAQSGQTLNPDDQQTMTAIAMMKKEGAKKRRMVKESEIQSAQVVLASQDMIDRLQKMTEELSEMQFKDLPALTDSIRNDMGVEQATQFQTQTAAALTALLAAVQQGKTQMEAAQGTITGDTSGLPGADTGLPMPGDDVGDLGDAGVDGMPGPDAEPGADDMGLDVDVDAEELSTPALGRERR